MSRKRLAIIIAGLVLVVVIAGIFATSSKKGGDNSSAIDQSSVDSLDGDYNTYTDASVKKYPEAGTVIDKNSEITIEYDGSKSTNDPLSLVNYELFYIMGDGSVSSMGGGPLTGKGNGVYALSKPVIKSEAEGKKGFLKLSVTYDVKSVNGETTAQSANLGYYSVSFK